MGSISFVCPSFARARNALHARARSATASAGAHLARAVRTTSRTCAAFDPAPRASRAKRSTPPAPAPLSPPPRAHLARSAALLPHLCRLRPRLARISRVRDAQHSSRTLCRLRSRLVRISRDAQHSSRTLCRLHPRLVRISRDAQHSSRTLCRLRPRLVRISRDARSAALPAPVPPSPPPRAHLARCAALLPHLRRFRPRLARVSRDAQHSSRTCAAFAPAPRASRAMRSTPPAPVPPLPPPRARLARCVKRATGRVRWYVIRVPPRFARELG
jgi:hypothetical protein